MTATLTQLMPAGRVTSYTHSLAGSAGPTALDVPGLGFFPTGPGGRAPILRAVIKHDKDSTGDLRIGGADSCEYPLAPGESFTLLVKELGTIHVRNGGADAAPFHVFLFLAE